MALGRLLHGGGPRPADSGGTIDHARAYEVLTTIGFAGRRRRAFSRLVALSGARPGEQVLDVGCGTGYLARLLAAVVAPGGQVTGVDPSPAMVGYARRGAPGIPSGGCAGRAGHAAQSDRPAR